MLQSDGYNWQIPRTCLVWWVFNLDFHWCLGVDAAAEPAKGVAPISGLDTIFAATRATCVSGLVVVVAKGAGQEMLQAPS